MDVKAEERMAEVAAQVDFDSAAVTSMHGALRAFVRRRVATASEADDLVQEAFTRLYAAVAARPVAEPQAYLFRIAANLIIDHRRRSSNPLFRADSFVDDFSPAVPPDQDRELRRQDLQRLFDQALAEMPERRRQVFILSRYEDKSTVAIALQLRITPRMVQKHLILAVSHLYDRLRPHMEDAP